MFPEIITIVFFKVGDELLLDAFLPEEVQELEHKLKQCDKFHREHWVGKYILEEKMMLNRKEVKE